MFIKGHDDRDALVKQLGKIVYGDSGALQLKPSGIPTGTECPMHWQGTASGDKGTMVAPALPPGFRVLCGKRPPTRGEFALWGSAFPTALEVSHLNYNTWKLTILEYDPTEA